MHILRVVLNSGSVTELMFDNQTTMRTACAVIESSDQSTWVSDDYGHDIFAKPEHISALVSVDLEAELKGHSTLTFERQMMQDRLSERVHKTRELASTPILVGRPGNGAMPNIIRS